MRGHTFGVLAIQPSDEFPDNTSSEDFELGHSLLGSADYEVVYFAFDFPSATTVLVQPAQPFGQSHGRLVQRDHYFILVIRPNNGVTVFRAGGDSDDLAGLKETSREFSLLARQLHSIRTR